VRRLAAGMAAVLALTVVIVADVNGFTPAAAGSAPTPGGISPVADTYVSGASQGSNYGTSTLLAANATGPVYTHLLFQVSGSNGATSATLQVYSTSSGATQTQVYAEPATWTETGLTYSSQPARGALLGKLSTLVASSYSTLTVPLTGDGTYAFVLTTTATAARNMTSRETSTPPQLVLSSTPPTTTTPRSNDPVIAAAGDIGCAANDPSFNNLNGTATACRSKFTEALIQNVIKPLVLLPLGDEQYNSGSPTDFAASYGKTWGNSMGISRPVVGNHEYGTSKASGYFNYFGSTLAGTSDKGYYSYDIGAWHMVAINTECTRIDGAVGCAVGSPQEKWLKADLAAHPNKCTLVYGHRPRWASSSFASADIDPLIVDMVAGGVDLYLTGHAHSYERFAPQDANGAANGNGLTQLTVGTGGAFYTGTGTIAANSIVRAKNLYGVEKLVLHPTSWDYSFVPENSSFGDTGTGTCH
jgi:hypothetical protein